MTAREKHEWRGLHAARGRSFGADGGGSGKEEIAPLRRMGRSA